MIAWSIENIWILLDFILPEHYITLLKDRYLYIKFYLKNSNKALGECPKVNIANW